VSTYDWSSNQSSTVALEVVDAFKEQWLLAVKEVCGRLPAKVGATALDVFERKFVPSSRRWRSMRVSGCSWILMLWTEMFLMGCSYNLLSTCRFHELHASREWFFMRASFWLRFVFSKAIFNRLDHGSSSTSHLVRWFEQLWGLFKGEFLLIFLSHIFHLDVFLENVSYLFSKFLLLFIAWVEWEMVVSFVGYEVLTFRSSLYGDWFHALVMHFIFTLIVGKRGEF